MDNAFQMQSIKYKLHRTRDDINVWQVVREDGDNKPYKVDINIEHVMEALDWLIEHNVLYEDLKDIDWRNEAAIQDYRQDATFVIQQHVAPKRKDAPPSRQTSNDE